LGNQKEASALGATYGGGFYTPPPRGSERNASRSAQLDCRRRPTTKPNRRDLLIEEFPELATALLELPEDVRYLDSDRKSNPEPGVVLSTTLYVQADGKILALSCTRFENGVSHLTSEEVDEH